jgi:dienelactone hydrolase
VLDGGGGLTNDEPGFPSATTSAETASAPSRAVGASGTPTAAPAASTATAPAATETLTAPAWSTEPHALQIEVMRQQSYPGSPITIEQTLDPGANYSRYIVSYRSDGYKIHALMTVPDGTGPNGTKPAAGWPVIIFNHGYIEPSEYRTTERYVAYVDMIARSGYIVFKSDYRGWGSSEGGSTPGGGYGSPALTVDVLNAVTSLQAYQDADPNRIGMWGHSLGGQLTLRAMVVSKAIKAGVIWGGVVAPYPDIIARWSHMDRATSVPQLAGSALRWIRDFSSWVEDFGTHYVTPEQNPAFWATISPNAYLADLSGPIQLHHSTTDEMVPVAWSETLAKELKVTGNQPYFELYTYPGDNHNINANFGVAMQRTVAFFDKYVKGQ